MKPYVYIAIVVALLLGLGVYKELKGSGSLGGPIAKLTVSNTTVTVTSGSSLVLDRNAGRNYARIEMVTTSGPRVWCSEQTASVSGTGWMISPTSNNPLILNVLHNNNPWTGQIFCNIEGYFGNNTSTLSVIEY